MVEKIQLALGTIAVCTICGETSTSRSGRKKFEKDHDLVAQKIRVIRTGAQIRIRVVRGSRVRWERFVLKRVYCATSKTYLTFPPNTIRPALHELCVELRSIQWPKQRMHLTYEVFEIRRSRKPAPQISAGMGRPRR